MDPKIAAITGLTISNLVCLGFARHFRENAKALAEQGNFLGYLVEKYDITLDEFDGLALKALLPGWTAREVEDGH